MSARETSSRQSRLGDSIEPTSEVVLTIEYDLKQSTSVQTSISCGSGTIESTSQKTLQHLYQPLVHKEPMQHRCSLSASYCQQERLRRIGSELRHISEHFAQQRTDRRRSSDMARSKTRRKFIFVGWILLQVLYVWRIS